MPDTTGYEPNGDDEPILDVRPVFDVVPLDGIDIVDIPPPGYEPEFPDDQPRPPPVDRPVVGSTLTGLGVIGTFVAAALPWSGGRNLFGSRALVTGQSWLVWLVLAVLVAALFGVVALVRPRRGVRWLGALTAIAGAVLSGWAFVGLPTADTVGVGPGLACVALVVLATGQFLAAFAGAEQPAWRWRPAGIAAAVVVAVLVAAAVGSAGLVNATDVDATTAAGPPVAVDGAAPSVVDREVWATGARVFDVAGSSALLVGESDRGAVTLAGVSVLDLRTGAERWHHYERGWIVREAALTADGTTAIVVVDTGDETDAVGLTVATGAVAWRQRLGSSINCVSPGADQITPVGSCAGQFITGDGVMYLGPPAPDGSQPVTYLNARDGRTWPVTLGTGCRVRGAGGDSHGLYVLDQCVTAGFPDPHLLNERAIAYTLDGRQRWSSPLDLVQGTVAGSFGPVFVRGDVVLVQQEQRYVALTTAHGAQLWTSTDPFEPENTVTDGSVLAWSTGVQVVMLDLHTGNMLWQQGWQFPEEADMPLIAGGRLYLIRHTIGPNPYTCAAQATLLTINPATGHGIGDAVLPNGAGNDCGPDVEDRSFLRGSLLVLVTADSITVLTGH